MKSIKIGERALLQRVNRAIADQGRKVFRCKKNSATHEQLGDFYEIDSRRKSVETGIKTHLDLAALAKKLGCLKPWESLVVAALILCSLTFTACSKPAADQRIAAPAVEQPKVQAVATVPTVTDKVSDYDSIKTWEPQMQVVMTERARGVEGNVGASLMRVCIAGTQLELSGGDKLGPKNVAACNKLLREIEQQDELLRKKLSQ